MRLTLTVILASDVAGYSRLVAECEEETIERFSQAAALFSDLVKKYQGTVFNTAGDAILARFDSAVDATRCALDMQDANNANNAQRAEHDKLLFRIGIAIGDVLVADDGDLLGDAVNVAARLEHLAEPGGICFSDDVRSHVLHKIRVTVVDLGDQNLRNIPRAVRAFKLVSGSRDAPARPQWLRQLAAIPPITWVTSVIAVVAVLSSAAMAWYFRPWSREQNTVAMEEYFDPARIPMVTDRVREALANYERDPDFKALAISREGWGLAIGAAGEDSAKREALDRCKQRDDKGICRIYAVGNVVIWSRTLLPLPFDVRSEVLEAPFLPDEGELISRRLRAPRVEAYLKEKDHKALAASVNGFWPVANRPTRSEAARLAFERCSDANQAPCLLVSVDGF